MAFHLYYYYIKAVLESLVSNNYSERGAPSCGKSESSKRLFVAPVRQVVPKRCVLIKHSRCAAEVEFNNTKGLVARW